MSKALGGHLLLLLSTVALGQVCGDTIAVDTTLTADVVCASTAPTGLTITASNVTLDGNGFRVILDGSGAGVRINPGLTDVTISNLDVSTTGGVGTGILLQSNTNVALTDVDASGRSIGINSSGNIPGFVAANVSVADAGDTGMVLRGVGGLSSLTGVTFDGSRQALRLIASTAGFVLDGTTNTFVGCGAPGSDIVELNTTFGAEVRNLDLSTGTATNALHLLSTFDSWVHDNTLSGQERGVYTQGPLTNTGLIIVDNDVSGSSSQGMYLDSVDSGLVLTGNTFDGSATGVVLQDLVGPLAIDPSNTFVGVGTGTNNAVVQLNSTVQVSLVGNDLSAGSGLGVGVFLDGTSDTQLVGVLASGRYRGVDTANVNTGLVLDSNDVSGSADYGMELDGVSGLVLTGNVFDGSTSGLNLDGLVGPWTLPTSNSFVGVGTSPTAPVIRLRGTTDITLADLDLSGAGDGYAVRMLGTLRTTIRDNDLSNRERGIYSSLSGSTRNRSTVIRDNLVTDADDWAMWLEGENSGLQLLRNDFTGADNGLRIVDLAGPVTLDMAASTFDGIGDFLSQAAMKVVDSSDVTVDGLVARVATNGIGLTVEGSTGVLASGLVTCDASTGLQLLGAQDTTVDGQFAFATDGVTVDAGTDNTTGSVSFYSVTNTIVDNGTNTNLLPGPAIDDFDGDGNPDPCDPCPTDPLDLDTDGDGVCDVVDLCVGDDALGDGDGDGFCADTDCDDVDPDTYPMAPELCDGIDNDCDVPTEIDEGALFGDTDGDTCDDCAFGPYDPANDGDDLDGDGLCDLGDPDADGDTVDSVDDVDDLDPSRCLDDDYDTCDDCSQLLAPDTADDGPDSDGDGFCDAVDFELHPAVLLDSVSWSPGGIGAPSVIWDSQAGQFVMVFETQIGPPIGGAGNCNQGTWALGLATSPDGINWTDAGGPVLSPDAGSSYHRCVVAHPSIVQHGGTTLVFFKAENEERLFTGLGSFLLVYDAGLGRYDVTTVTPTPALTQTVNFGYPKAVYAGGQYKVAFTQKPNMFIATGSSTNLSISTLPVLSTGFDSYAPDEVFNPAIGCDDAGGFVGFIGGRALDVNEAVVAQGMGRRVSTSFDIWNPGAGPLTTLPPEMRHWDVLQVGTSDYLLFFDEIAGGGNRVRMAYTNPAWQVADVQDKVCP